MMRLLSQKTVTRHLVSLREDGILHIHVYNQDWNVEDKKLLFPAIGEMVNYKKIPLLLTYEKFVLPSSEEIATYAVKEFACPYFKVDAIVTDSLSLKILGNFFLQVQTPLRETKLFDNEAKAVEWLKEFL